MRQASSKPSWISRLVARLPTAIDATPEVVEYLLVLDRVLEDRRITDAEGTLLTKTADELGLLREQVINAHDDYLRNLINLAMGDGIVSDTEKLDLKEVSELLGIDDAKFCELVAMAPGDEAASTDAAYPSIPADDLRGKTICFTGESSCSIGGELVTRERAEVVATSLGMTVVQNVSKRLDFLVAADPDSLSGKAQKARKYGIRIIAEPVFWRMARVQTD
jgi:DNA polymerase-3 subunit epsilon